MTIEMKESKEATNPVNEAGEDQQDLPLPVSTGIIGARKE